MDEPEIQQLDNDVTLVHVQGRLDMTAVVPLRAVVADQVARGHVRLVIDLRDVEFMDSSGLGALLSSLKATRQAGGDLRIARPTEQVELVLQLTNVTRVLAAYEDPRTAYIDA